LDFKKSRKSVQSWIKYWNSIGKQLDIMAEISVADALQSMFIGSELEKILSDNSSIWLNFGKKTSSTLRTKLMQIMQKANLSKEAKFMVYFFAAAVKDPERMLIGMNSLPDTMKTKTWFNEVQNFIRTSLVKYTVSETANRFAVVHLPTTNPGLDCLCAALMMPPTINALNTIVRRVTFCQMHNSPSLQEVAKEGYKAFWENTIKSSKNTNRPKDIKIGFVEEFYETSASDSYKLVDKNMREFTSYNESVGLTLDDVKTWLMGVHSVSMLS